MISRPTIMAASANQAFTERFLFGMFNVDAFLAGPRDHDRRPDESADMPVIPAHLHIAKELAAAAEIG
jgi:hypothetical protein